jgi:hypothetical protein
MFDETWNIFEWSCLTGEFKGMAYMLSRLLKWAQPQENKCAPIDTAKNIVATHKS